MKKKKITGKQVKFIISIISLGIFVFSYFYLYEGYMDKTEKAYRELEMIRAEIKDREKKLAEEETVRVQVEEVNKRKQEILDSFPVYIAKEDNFMFVEEMVDHLKLQVSSIVISDNNLFFETILPSVTDSDSGILAGDTETASQAGTSNPSEQTGNEKDAKPVTMDAYVNTVSMNFLTSYEGFKNMTEYIRDYPDPTIIDNVTVSYDSSTGALAGNMTLKRFSLSGTGKEYKAPSIEGIEIGTDNIFGTEGKKMEESPVPEH